MQKDRRIFPPASGSGFDQDSLLFHDGPEADRASPDHDSEDDCQCPGMSTTPIA